MATDPVERRARAARFREKAAELRKHIERSPAIKQDFERLAREYESMADQLDGIFGDRG